MVEFFRWGNPSALAWLWLLPGLVLLHLYAMRRRRIALELFCPDLTESRLGLRSITRRRHLKFALFAGAVAMLVLALAQPMVGQRMEKARRKGAEIVIAIDTSLSMAARDVEPSRLEAAKKAAYEIINRLANDRVSIVVFAGAAYKYCPLTVDHDAALMFLDSVTLSSTPQPGTAVGEAMRIAGEILGQAEGKHRAMLLLSDGEDHAPGALEAANKLNRETGAAIMVLGVGTPEGEPLPMVEDSGAVADFKRDERGEVVISQLNEPALQELARAGNGLYKRIDEPSAIAHISTRLESLEGIQVGTYVYTDYGQRFQWPLLIAILLLAAEALIAEQRVVPRERGEYAE